MSRAFSPPDTLSSDDIQTVADVRRAVWINGMIGLVGGAFTGTLGHLVLQKLQKKYILEPSSAAGKVNDTSWIYKCLRPLPPLGKNTFMLSLMAGGALGSFVFSTTAGKNAVHMLHPIFSLGRDETAGKSPYQIAQMKAEQLEEEQMIDTTNSATTDNDELDAAHHRTRSVQRKLSIKRRLETGHSLSDTHNNTWPEVETEEMQKEKQMHRAESWGKRQSNRKNTLKERIERGKALSNSTGGNWGDDE